MKKGFTLIELLIVVAIIAILAAIAVPNFLEAQVRAKVSRAQSDMRSLATAIEAYYVDNNTYPLSSAGGFINGTVAAAAFNGNDANYNAALSNTLDPANTTRRDLQARVFTFGSRTGSGSFAFATLTTPIGYVTSLFPEPFANFRQATFSYLTDVTGNRWQLASNGPDLIAQLHTTPPGPVAKNVESGFDLTVAVFAATYAYDPTNGTVSGGDVYRLKQ